MRRVPAEQPWSVLPVLGPGRLAVCGRCPGVLTPECSPAGEETSDRNADVPRFPANSCGTMAGMTSSPLPAPADPATGIPPGAPLRDIAVLVPDAVAPFE